MKTPLCATACGATLALALAAPAAAQIAPAPGSGLQTKNRAEPAVTAYPSAAAGDGGLSGGYSLSRWAEDWRSYAILRSATISWIASNICRWTGRVTSTSR